MRPRRRSHPRRRSRRAPTPASARGGATPGRPRRPPPAGRPGARSCRAGGRRSRPGCRRRAGAPGRGPGGGSARRFLQVGGGEHDRGAVDRGPGDQPPQVGPADRVDAGGRLVEDHQLRPVEQGPDDAQLLAHAPGQVAGQAVTEPVEARALQVGVRPGPRLGRGDPVGAGGEREVLVDREVGVGARRRRQVADLDGVGPPDHAAGDRERAGQRPQQRGLARPVTADDARSPDRPGRPATRARAPCGPRSGP